MDRRFIFFIFNIIINRLIWWKFKRSLTNYISLNSSEIFKQVFKIVVIYLSMTILIFILKLVNLRTYDAYNYSLSISSADFYLMTLT